MKTPKELENFLRSLMEPPPSLSVSDWADTFCQLPSDSAEPGRYKTSRVEYMREVMNAFTQSDVHKIIVKSSSQVGKSAVLLNIVGRTAHLDPANIMIIQPTLETAMDFPRAAFKS